MKKVLFVATITKHINAFHLPYLKWFKEQGYEVHVASNGNEKIKYCDKHFDLPFARFPLKKENVKAYKQLKKIINENNYQIIHCHTPVGGVLARLTAKRARKSGTRIIYTAHGFHFFKGAPLLNWIIYYPIEKIMARYTDCLITINQEDYDFAKKHFEKIKQIELIHGVGVDENKFNFKMTDKKKLEVRKKIGLKEKDFVITYVAELNKNKNQSILIEAIQDMVLIEKNKKIKVLLIGKGNNEEYLKKRIENNDLKEHIFLLGYRKDIPQLLSITNLYVATSKREGLGLNVVEAMMMGLPIIATSNRGHRELVKNNENGYLVETDSSIQLSEKIQKLINDDELIKKFVNEGFKRVEPYKLKNVMKEMERIYKNNG